MNSLLFTLYLGVGATAVMDAWGLARKPLLGVAPPDYAPVGRWIAHMPRGRFRHESIAASAPVRGERIIGWTAHYLIGIAFAAVLIGIGVLHGCSNRRWALRSPWASLLWRRRSF